MAANPQPLTKKDTAKQSAWKALASHYETVSKLHLRQLFADDPERGTRLTAEAVGLYFDYSKNRITDQTLKLLIQLAQESGLRQRIDAMFRGERINVTEKRAVLHAALRAPRDISIAVDGENVVPKVHAVLDRMTPARVRGAVPPDTAGVDGSVLVRATPSSTDRRFVRRARC